MEGMTGVATTRIRANVHTLVYWVKNIREMGCIHFQGEEDAEVVGY